MNIIPVKNEMRYENNVPVYSVEIFEVTDGLDLDKTSDYLRELIANGYAFSRAEISSASDKDNWTVFPGSETFWDSEEFFKVLNADFLKDEERVSVIFDGKKEDDELGVTIRTYTNRIEHWRPLRRKDERDKEERPAKGM